MKLLPFLADKIGSIGAFIAAAGCAACFPALGALGASIGLGALAQFEGLFINTLLPIFAGVALLANLISWFNHRVGYRGLLSISGPCMVLATLFLFWTDDWSTQMFYVGIALMIVVSLLDVISPANKQCEVKK
ncbi:MAG: mercury transporter MerC [Cycloclasticus sp. symbiont of Poecilosclerida sp. M]|nr:MAG: mercury transporter MerC [Cycloclasticus sp. symbiont of Poecilosclerida sp. M]